jgi:hypothetical protein
VNLKATLDEQELAKVRSIAQDVVGEERRYLQEETRHLVRQEFEKLERRFLYGWDRYSPLSPIGNYWKQPLPPIYIPKDSLTSLASATNRATTPAASAPAEKAPDLGKYAGKLVFVEVQGNGSDGKPFSNYYNGEYFIIRDTPGTLYAVKLTAGYGGHDIRQLSLIGQNPYKVLASYAPSPDQITGYIKDMSEFLEQGKTKKQWVDSAYTSAESNLRAVKRATGR